MSPSRRRLHTRMRTKIRLTERAPQIIREAAVRRGNLLNRAYDSAPPVPSLPKWEATAPPVPAVLESEATAPPVSPVPESEVAGPSIPVSAHRDRYSAVDALVHTDSGLRLTAGRVADEVPPTYTPV
ncbi:hypothetical protein B0H10DRAFT_1962253 [Mycena sp. CBHHK59/15]|nr:hypothetical protein B0H10DRAFT_1962253 [Mycena sp. CBHHK59/15]